MEAVLDAVVARLDARLKAGPKPRDSREFEEWVVAELTPELAGRGLSPLGPHVAQQFPDLTVDTLGIELKYVSEALWSGVANSIHESRRIPGITKIYVLFGKGGARAATRGRPAEPPGATWGHYEQVVYHARTSHRLRFELDMSRRADRPSLFARWGIGYDDFAALSYPEKMGYMQAYARTRQQENDDLEFWWLPPTPRPYTDLPPAQQDEALALACLMCPQIVTGTDQARKEVAVCMQLLKGVLMHEARAAFSDNPVADLRRIEQAVVTEADKVISDVFQVYWNARPDQPVRIREWVRRLDAAHEEADMPGERPSSVLFRGAYRP